MTENPAHQTPAEPIAIVGMACRFPDAAGPAEFLELVLTGRQAFRRLPPTRLDVSEYGDGEPGFHSPSGLAPGAFGSARAALLEGWRFDRAAYGVTQAAYQAADPAHWLALETAARALADGGFPGGQGLARDRTGVIIGNTLTGEVSRATALRTRWPYVRRVLRAALAAGEVPPERHADVIEHAAAGFLAPFPEIGDDTLAGGLPGAIADRICGHFGFRGGGHAVDAAHSSSLLAIAAACSALTAGDLDAAIAGGVDISLDPFELAGLAGTGVLASGEMRVFDARPTGFLPGEGCGLTVLMRAAEARAAGVPVYAEIAGWGVSSAGNPALTKPGSASLLLALRRAYHRARVDPSDVQLIEGDGTGTASGDLAELTSLAEIRQASPRLAALGSVKANIGHTKAAAGAAGLIKATLAIAAGIIPPATGCARPHPLIASEDARLRAPGAAEPWLERIRLAGVTSVGPGGASVHLILRRTRAASGEGAGPALFEASTGSPEHAGMAGAGSRGWAGKGPGRRSRHGPVPGPWVPRLARPQRLSSRILARVETFAVSGPDHQALGRELARIAELAPWLSDGELHDLACQYGRATAGPYSGAGRPGGGQPGQPCPGRQGGHRAASGLDQGKLVRPPGIVMSDRGRGHVVLLFPGEGSPPPGPHPGCGTDAGAYDPAVHPAVVAASLSALRLAERARGGRGGGSRPRARRDHRPGLGGLPQRGRGRPPGHRAGGAAWRHRQGGPDRAGLHHPADRSPRPCAPTAAWSSRPTTGPGATCWGRPGRGRSRPCATAGQGGIPARVLDSPVAPYSPAMADRVAPMRKLVREFSFRPPGRRLISTVTGAEVTARDDIAAMLCTQLTSPVLFARALECAAAEADLLIETGPGRKLTCLAADCSDLPAFSLAAGRPDESATAHAAAALFGSGAVPTLAPLFAGRLARPIDIWRERIFIPSPCGAPAANGDSAGAGRQATDGEMTGRVSAADRRLVAGRAPATGGDPQPGEGPAADQRHTAASGPAAGSGRAAGSDLAPESGPASAAGAVGDRRAPAEAHAAGDGRVSHGGRVPGGAAPGRGGRAPGDAAPGRGAPAPGTAPGARRASATDTGPAAAGGGAGGPAPDGEPPIRGACAPARRPVAGGAPAAGNRSTRDVGPSAVTRPTRDGSAVPDGGRASGGGSVAKGALPSSDGIATGAGPSRGSGSGGRETVTSGRSQASGAALSTPGGPATDDDPPDRSGVAAAGSAPARPGSRARAAAGPDGHPAPGT